VRKIENPLARILDRAKISEGRPRTAAAESDFASSLTAWARGLRLDGSRSRVYPASVATANPLETATSRPRRRFRRTFGSALIVLGVLVLAWTVVVWRWNDPFTSVYTRWQQHKLADEYTALTARYHGHRVSPRASTVAAASVIRADARRFRVHATQGDAIGRIVVPRLDLDMVLVNGTDTATLRTGPGRDPRTYMPGEGELVYIAGHRTTYLAPFARIDELRPGDPVTLQVPYGTFEYTVTGHRIVESDDLSVLRSHHRDVVALQACHPRFFATHRYIVWAKLVRVTPRDGTAYVP
jgi:sortase A